MPRNIVLGLTTLKAILVKSRKSLVSPFSGFLRKPLSPTLPVGIVFRVNKSL